MENSQQPGKEYKPVNDDFYDQLEAAATLRQNCEITYLDEEGKEQEVIAQIKDLYVDERVEYARLDNHHVIRLDRITCLNGNEMISQQAAYNQPTVELKSGNEINSSHWVVNLPLH